MIEKKYVTCAVCKRRILGKIPFGGDGSILFPRKHHRRETWSAAGISIVQKDEVCEGSNQPAKEYEV